MKKYCAKKCKSYVAESQLQNEIYKELRSYIERIPEDADLDEQARIIYKRWSKYPLDHFLNTNFIKKYRVAKALDNGEGWAARLIGTLENPYVYNLRARHLKLPPECADPKNFYRKSNVVSWKKAIEALLIPPFRWKLELATQIHVHIIADRDAGSSHIPRGGKVVQPIHDLNGLLLYHAKPYAVWNARNLALYLRAKRQGRLPRLSGTVGIPNRKTWHSTAAHMEGQSQS